MSLSRIGQIERCYNTTSRVWLTFDDSGSAAQIRSILATLKKNNVKGRFFFHGKFANANPSLVRLVRNEGHLLANHTYGHVALSKATDSQVSSQVARGVNATTSPKLLRPPFGAGALSTRLEQLASSSGYKLCRWTVDTRDWDRASVSQMVERVKYGDSITPPVSAGGVILMHAHGRNTSGGLQSIINAVRSKHLVLDKRR
jgi:peptidoglycan/xylan/chitin deacetylase (PgdA/CDA1 family)